MNEPRSKAHANSLSTLEIDTIDSKMGNFFLEGICAFSFNGRICLPTRYLGLTWTQSFLFNSSFPFIQQYTRLHEFSTNAYKHAFLISLCDDKLRLKHAKKHSRA